MMIQRMRVSAFIVKTTGLCVMLVACNACFADENRSEGIPGQDSVTVPQDWSEVDLSRRLEILQMVADQSAGNYQSIRTWKGTYAVRVQERLSQGYVARTFGGRLEKPDVVPLIYEVASAMRFAIDRASESTYRFVKSNEMRFFKEGSNETVEMPNVAPLNKCSLVTPEHYVHFSPEVVWPGFTMLRDHPQAQNRPAAFREPREKAKGGHLGELMDPCSFFGFSTVQKFWEELHLYIRVMRGDDGKDRQRECDEILTVYQAARPEGTWYRLMMELTGPDDSQTYLTTVWSPVAGFNPISKVMSKDRAGEQLIETTQWHWQRFDDVFVPASLKESTYSPDTGKLTYQREVDLEKCVVNGPLEPGQFTYRGLGLAEGDLVVDNIEDAVYVMRGGEPEKLADFAEPYRGLGESGLSDPLIRWFLTAVGVVGVMVVVLYFRARRAKRRTEGRADS